MILKKIKEAFVGEAKGETRMVSLFSESEMPEVTFKQLIDYYLKTPQIQLAISSYAEMITGTELQINSDNEKAKEVIEEWNRKNNFYDKFEGLVTTILICGAGLLEKLDETTIEDVLEVDMKTIKRKKRNQYGDIEYYEQQKDDGTIEKLDPKRYIEFNLSSFSRSAWGNSLFHSLAVPRQVGNRNMKPLIESLWAIEDSMTAIINNHAYPLQYHVFEGANDEQLEKESEKLRKRKPGQIAVVSRKPEIVTHEVNAQSKFTDYVRHIEKVIEIGTQFPSDILTGDFTSRASSDTTENIIMKRVRGYQRYLSNKLKHELYDIILSQNGIAPETANLSISFTSQNIIKLTPEQMLANANSNKISTWEYREWLKVNTGLDLFDDDVIQGNMDMKQQIVQQRANQIKKELPPQNDEKEKERENVVGKKIRKCQPCKEHQHAFCLKRGCQCH